MCARAEEKLQKYLPLLDDIALQTREHPQMFAIAIGVTGAVSKVTENAVKKLNDLRMKLKLSKLQKAAAIGTAKIMKKHLHN